MSAHYVPVPGVPKLHHLGHAELSVVKAQAVVEVDDAAGARLRLAFSPVQAVRARTADLFLAPGGSGFAQCTVLEVLGSPWLAELSAGLAQLDPHATFMRRAHHYLLSAGDSVIEVAAWGLEWLAVGVGGFHPAEPADAGPS